MSLLLMPPPFRRLLPMRLLVLLAALLLPLLVQAQPLPDRRPLLGRVTGFRGVPIGGATITIRRTDETPTAYWGARLLTDARGEFTIPNAEDGAYYISIADVAGYSQEDNHAFTLSATNQRFEIALQKLSPLHLRLLKTDGTPLGSATVSVRLRSPAGAARVQRMSTDSAGTLNVPDLLPGTYSADVLARGAGWGTVNGLNVQPDSPDTPLDLRLQSGGSLHVQVSETPAGGTPRPLGGATLFVTPASTDNAQDRAQGRLDASDGADMSLLSVHYDRYGLVSREGDGTIDLSDLAPGRYLLRPFLSGYVTTEARPIEIKAGETTSIDFNLAPSANIKFTPLTVVLHDAAGKPLANADWVLQLRFLGGEGDDVTVPPPPGMPQGVPQELLGGAWRRGHSDADGKVVLYPVRIGRWRVGASSPRDVTPQLQLAARTVTVTTDATTATVTLQVGGGR